MLRHYQKRICLILSLLLVFSLGILLPAGRAEAADVNVIIHISPEGEVSVGDTVTATITVRGELVWDTTLNVSYPADLLECADGSGGSVSVHIDGESAATVSFKAKANGSARISTGGTAAYDSQGNTLEIEHAGDTVTIGKPEATTEKKTETEKKSEEATTEKASEDASEGTSEEASTEQKITVDAKDARAVLDGVTYVFVEPKNPMDIPAGYVLTSVRYLNWMVPAYISQNKLITIVALVDASTLPPIKTGTTEEGQEEQETQETEDTQETTETQDEEEMTEQLVAWYRLEEKDSILTPYVEYSAADMRFIPIEKPSNVKVPDGYDKVSMDLGHGALTTYQSFQLDKIVLIYGATPTGTEGFYYFDTVEKTFIRYIPLKDVDGEQTTAEELEDSDQSKATAAEADEGIFTRDNLSKMLIGAVALFLLMAIFAMVLMIQNAKLGNRLEAAEEKLHSLRRKYRGADPEEERRVSARKDREYDEETDSGEGEDDEDEDDDDIPEHLKKELDRPMNGQTIEIIMEEAEDNNSSVKMPPVRETRRNRVEDAMKDRPYGIDSAFDVVEGGDEPEPAAVSVKKEAVDSKTQVHVKSKEPQKVALPGDDNLEDE